MDHSTPSDLIRDHLFQQNLVIWLTQPLDGPSDVHPILYKAGFSVVALSRQLSLPPDIAASVQKARLMVK